jgi:hypothetical protein
VSARPFAALKLGPLDRQRHSNRRRPQSRQLRRPIGNIRRKK